MPNRVAAPDVRTIFDTDLLDPVLETFITVANGVVTGYLGGTFLSSDELTEIEKFLAAHLASTMRDPQAKAEGVTGGAGVNITYHGQSGMGLDASLYGQTVKMLDRTGLLANLKKRAMVFAVTSFNTKATPSVLDV